MSSVKTEKKKTKKSLSLYLDDQIEKMIEEIQKKMPGLSKNDVIRLAIIRFYESIVKDG